VHKKKLLKNSWAAFGSMKLNKRLLKFLEILASIELTLTCLVLMMALVLFGTLAQAKIGTFAAQRLYFSTWVITTSLGDFNLPIFPGGLTVGTLWILNLIAAFFARFRYGKRDTGILIAHFGLILLVGGQGLTQILARENRLAIQEGETSNYIVRDRENELAFTMVSNPTQDEVITVPYSIYSRQRDIRHPALPFRAVIKAFFPNADLKMGSPSASLATQGIGTQVAVQNLPVSTRDDQPNNTTAFVEIFDGPNSLGTWLVSAGLGAPQSFTVDSKEYRLAIRPRREYLPYRFTLKDFKHDIYPGTDIPKNFSSLVHLEDPERKENRDVLIYMNHPLRYRGKTFYQASFGNNDTLSIFQVVENPIWLTPYISCVLVVLGLLLQFLSHLSKFVRSRR
jgi:hypothetical protein